MLDETNIPAGTCGAAGMGDWERRHLGGEMVGRVRRTRRVGEMVGADHRAARTLGILPVAACGLAHDTHEPEIVARLFKLYADKMKWCG